MVTYQTRQASESTDRAGGMDIDNDYSDRDGGDDEELSDDIEEDEEEEEDIMDMRGRKATSTMQTTTQGQKGAKRARPQSSTSPAVVTPFTSRAVQDIQRSTSISSPSHETPSPNDLTESLASIAQSMKVLISRFDEQSSQIHDLGRALGNVLTRTPTISPFTSPMRSTADSFASTESPQLPEPVTLHFDVMKLCDEAVKNNSIIRVSVIMYILKISICQ